jgi:hypothetical protein
LPLALAQGDDDLVQEANVELLTDGVEDGANQQCTEKTLRHCAQRVNAVTLAGEHDVLAFEEIAEFAHSLFHSLSVELRLLKKRAPEEYSDPRRFKMIMAAFLFVSPRNHPTDFGADLPEAASASEDLCPFFTDRKQ